MNWNDLMKVDSMIKMTDVLGRGISRFLQGQAIEYQEEANDYVNAANKEINRIQQQYFETFGLTGGIINPLMFTNSMQSFNENSDTFLTRTLMTGSDIADRNYLSMASWDTNTGAQGLPSFDPSGATAPSTSANPFSGSGFGLNLDTGKFLLSGLGTLGNLWNSYNANRLAKDQFNYTKRITDQNMANQTQAYNTTLDDRIRSRAVAEGLSADAVKEYMNKNRL